MILNSIDKQLILAEDGQICWQRDLTNPMPGEPVAKVKKGDHLLEPSCELLAGAPALEGQDSAAVLKFIQEWLGRYVKTVLEPLFNLQDEALLEGAPREIAQKLYEALGILPREELQELIGQMDEEKRACLRVKKIRFGPLVVYLPELNKPAAVRLRAQLLTLWQGKALPADVPTDGIVSFSVDGKEIDTDYYRSIGYPVYGPRSIRVDMLDRVVCAIYDGAKEGKFSAQHNMAEWLGSNIADLYAVLEAMGHKKIYDPAEQVEAEPEVAEALEVKAEENPSDENKTTEEKKEASTEKPVLATFRLKKGKASQSKTHSISSDKKFTKPDNKKFKPKHKKSGPKREPKERVYKAEVEAKLEDSPFAILQQLQVGKKDK